MVNIFPEDVVPICTSSLVHLNDGKIQLAHFSVQEFLLISERGSQHHECQFSVTAGHNYLAQKSVDYLLTQTRVLANEEEALGQPFPAYAAEYWYTHVAALGAIDQLNPDFQAEVHRLFTEFNVYSNWIRVVRSIAWSEYPQWRWIKSPQTCEPPLHRASKIGLLQIVDDLLNRVVDNDVVAQGNYGTALQEASAGGY